MGQAADIRSAIRRGELEMSGNSVKAYYLAAPLAEVSGDAAALAALCFDEMTEGEGNAELYSTRLYERAAKLRNPLGQLMVAMRLFATKPRGEDNERAIRNIQLSAASENAAACGRLAQIYYTGEFIGYVDVTKAEKLARSAAEAGDDIGQFVLGMMHARGLGGAMDYDKALHWLSLAAAQDHVDAQRRLG